MGDTLIDERKFFDEGQGHPRGHGSAQAGPHEVRRGRLLRHVRAGERRWRRPRRPRDGLRRRGPVPQVRPRPAAHHLGQGLPQPAHDRLVRRRPVAHARRRQRQRPQGVPAADRQRREDGLLRALSEANAGSDVWGIQTKAKQGRRRLGDQRQQAVDHELPVRRLRRRSSPSPTRRWSKKRKGGISAFFVETTRPATPSTASCP